MSEHPVKTYPTLGCCGLDCGLCPRYSTVGSSRCPGCCGPGFFDRHPSCGCITCCVKKKNLEVCAQCVEFPCSRFEPWLATAASGEHDSFVTHRKIQPNLDFIRNEGLEKFIERQSRRIGLLETMIKGYDDGRSRSFYCVAAALLSIDSLETGLREGERNISINGTKIDDTKNRAKILKWILNDLAETEGIELKLGNKERR